MTDLAVFPDLENSISRAQTRFSEAVGIAKQLAASERLWITLARLLSVMEKAGDLERLGFHSVNACIAEIETLSGYSKSSIYAYRKLYEECGLNQVDVPDMPVESAHVFKQLPAQLQRDPQVVDAVKRMKPNKFREKMVVECPEAHVEYPIFKRFTASQWEKINETLNLYRQTVQDMELSDQEAIEGLVQSWVECVEELVRLRGD